MFLLKVFILWHISSSFILIIGFLQEKHYLHI